MLTSTTRNQIFSILQRNAVDLRYSSLILLYKIICKIIKQCPTRDTGAVQKFLVSSDFGRALSRYSDMGITRLFSNPSHLPDVLTLCQIFQEGNLHINPVECFVSIAPGMVADWSSLQQITEDATVDVLHQLFMKTDSIAGTTQIFSCNPYLYPEVFQKLLPDATNKQVEAIWNAIFHARYDAPEYNNTRAKKAISLFAAKGKGRKDVLSHYFLEFQDVGVWPLCFKDLDESKKKQIKPYAEPDENNVSYYTAGKYLALDNPTNILEELYYKGNYDPAIDCTLLINRFLASIQRAANPVIINPSLQFLSLWSSRKPEKPAATIIVPSRQIALALSTQFQDLSFTAAEDFSSTPGGQEQRSQPIDADLVLLSCPIAGSDVPQLDNLLNAFRPKSNCELICYTTEHLAVGKNSTLLPKLKERLMQVNQIICAPPSMVATKAKRKVILVANACSKEDAERNAYIPIYQCKTSCENNYVFVSPEIVFSRLATIWKNHSLKPVSKPAGPVERTRNHAKLIHWSKEIVIGYSVYPDDKGVRARVFVLRLDGAESQKGKRCNAIPGEPGTEKFYHARTEEELLSKIKDYPLRPELHEPILRDVVRVYGNQPAELTIKTIWLCLRPYLPKRNDEDEIAQEIFCGPKQSISNLKFSASFDEYAAAFRNVLGVDEAPVKYWRILRQVAEAGIKYGYLEKNPLDPYTPIVENNARQKVYSIQDSLRKWCFSDQELDRMVAPLITPVVESGTTVFPYAVDSHALLKLFALFSMIKKDELVALNHGDIVALPNGGAQALVTKFVDKHGNIVEYNSRGKDRHRRRKVALPPLLAFCYCANSTQLQERYHIDTSIVQSMPLFLEAKPKRSNALKSRRCSLKMATALYSELLKSAEVPEFKIALLEEKQTKLIDLGLPRKTENVFRNHLRISGARYGLADGELSYAAGTSPDATIDAHYIGYDAAQNQIATSAKFHRMTAKYYGRINARKAIAKKQIQQISEPRHQMMFKSSIDRSVSALLELIPKDPTNTPGYRIKITSRYGHHVNASTIKEDMNND